MNLNSLYADNPKKLQSLNEADQGAVQSVLDQVAAYIAENRPEKIALFGYWSIIDENGDLLGREQKDVSPGQDVLRASIPGFEIAPVTSTKYYGTDKLPGSAVGLVENPNGKTEGVAVVIKTNDPQWGIEKAVRAYLDREIFAEAYSPDTGSVADEILRQENAGSKGSYSMYQLRFGMATLQDGSEMPSLYVITNPQSPKNPFHDRFKGGDGITAQETVNRLAYQIAFGDGIAFWQEQFGAPGPDNYEASEATSLRYLEQRLKRREEMGYANPTLIQAAIARAKEYQAAGHENLASLGINNTKGIATPTLFAYSKILSR